MKRRVIDATLFAFDLVLAPVTLFAALWLKAIRRGGVFRLRTSRAILRAVGVFPIRDHYYEPLFHPRHIRTALDASRPLPGVVLDDRAQLALLAEFRWQEELSAIPWTPPADGGFGYDNPNFRAGDAEFFYSAIRHFRPRQLVEIGSGMSTLVARLAINANVREAPGYACRHVCVEPYEMPWLERVPGLEVMRERVETVDRRLFTNLSAGDILFIDSSHVIRPQGDVLVEFLDILPRLAPGVLIHVHDIFTPRDYPSKWLLDEVRLWNEQYLLEAFLTCNSGFRIVAALNHLHHTYPREIGRALPVLGARASSLEPGSFWLQRIADQPPNQSSFDPRP